MGAIRKNLTADTPQWILTLHPPLHHLSQFKTCLRHLLRCAVSENELAAHAQISAAKRRAVEVRAEAAMLVEAVEDRAYSVRPPLC